jgi:V8-like Glu-specific endopeptidase
MPHETPHSLPMSSSSVHAPGRAPGRVLAVAAALALVGACTVEDELDAADDEAVPVEIERDGLAFEWLAPVLEQEVEPGPDAVIRPLTAAVDEPRVGVDERTVRADADEPVPLEEWSRDELADALRPAIATRHGIYLAKEPAWAAADAVLQGRFAPELIDVLPREGEGRPHVEPEGGMVSRAIIGSDGRTRVVDTQAAPYRNIVKLQLYSGNTYRGWCSGSYIGPWTLITAAHCLVFSNTDRIDRIVFEPARNGGVLPYGSYDCRLDDASTNNDYLWSVPNGYLIGQNESLDYAVLDTFPCHSAPNWFSGYAANTGNTTYSMHGYTSGTCPGAPGPDNYMCGMSGSAYLNDWRIETEHIDSMGGQSGGPWYGWFNGAHKPAGVHVGYREYFDLFRCGFDMCRRNFARRIDAAFNTFIIDVAWDF